MPVVMTTYVEAYEVPSWDPSFGLQFKSLLDFPKKSTLGFQLKNVAPIREEIKSKEKIVKPLINKHDTETLSIFYYKSLSV